MRLLVLGCGSIGKRHIRNLLSLKCGEIIAVDVDENKVRDMEKELSIQCYSSINNALSDGRYDAAFICTPPRYHVQQALLLLDNGLDCFIEKPLSHNLDGLEELLKKSKREDKVVLIGYNLRFSALLRRIKEMIDRGAIGKLLSIRASVGYYLPYWRPNEDYRKGYSARKELGGGIVLDASHEIDYVRLLAGEVKEVFAVCKKISSMEIDTEDFAEVIMYHTSGVYSQVHFDYLQTNYRRGCEIIGEAGTIIWDINERYCKLFTLSDKEYHVYYEGVNANINDMYLEELQHFFRCLERKEKPHVDLIEGRRIQEIIEKIKKSSEEKRTLPV